MIRLIVILTLATLLSGCATRRGFVGKSVPTLADPPSVSQAELKAYRLHGVVPGADK